MTNPPDQHARTTALDPRRSFAVSAPAGSGKTGLLTQRVLALLATCEQPENILAITFTKKAATEMQSRIISALRQTETQAAPPVDDFEKTTWSLAKAVLMRDKECQWQLLTLPNRLRITTIDSFCRQLSQQSPLHNSLGHTPDVMDNPSAAYLQAARETLGLVESDTPIKDDLIRLIKHFNNQLPMIEQLFIRLLSKRDQWLSALFSSKDQRHYLEKTLQSVIEEQLTATKKSLKTFDSDLASLADYAANNLQASDTESIIRECLGLDALPSSHYQSKQQWLGLAELLLTAKGEPRKRITKAQGFPAADKTMSAEQKQTAKVQKDKIQSLISLLEEQPEIISLLASIKILPSPHYSESQWTLLDSLTRILHRLVAELSLTFQQLGKTDYIEITLAALSALGEPDTPSDLSLILEYRLQHILIDEFQDTSSTQLELIKRLTSGWQNDDNHTLFVVGDAMQSCYRFRNANVGIFLEVREHGLGNIDLTPLDLEVNFRSQENIVNWLNALFTPLFPEKNSINQGAVSYSPAIAFNKAIVDQPVSIDIFVQEEKDFNRDHEAEHIIALIKTAQEKNPAQSIAILVRGRAQVPPITQALGAHHISHHAVDIDSLAHNMAIQDLLSLTRALLYPNDRIAWLSILRAPWCGLDMYDLHMVANPSPSISSSSPTLWTTIQFIIQSEKEPSDDINCSAEGLIRLKQFNDTLTASYQKYQRCRLCDWIESTWLDLGGPANLIDQNDTANTELFFNLIDQHENGGRIHSWEDFSTAVNSLYAKPKTEKMSHSTALEIGLEDNKIPPVQLMTIHKSKGLEFDTVIIPGIDRSNRSNDPELLEWLEVLNEQQYSNLLISPIHATGDEVDSIYHYIRQQSHQKQLLESDRVFYVACTRAIEQLHLIGTAVSAVTNTPEKKPLVEKQSEPQTTIKVTNNSILQKIWPYIQTQANLIVTEHRENNWANASIENFHPNVIVRQSTDQERPKIIENHLLKKYRLAYNGLRESNDGNIAKPDALLQRHSRYFGTVLHKAIQQITDVGYHQFSDEKLQRQKIVWELELRQLGMPDDEQKIAIRKIVATIKNMLSSEVGQWLLDKQHIESCCEKSIYYSDSNTIKQAIIDRTFIASEPAFINKDIDNRLTLYRWIIDYKSSTNDSTINTLSTENFLAQEVALYRNQLKTYTQCFEAEAYPTKAALYFPLLGRLAMVDTTN